LHLKDYREGESAVKKTLLDLVLPLHVFDELLKKGTYVGTPINYGKKGQVNIILNLIRAFFHYKQADSELPHFTSYQVALHVIFFIDNLF
jgi:hypothetical protein